MSAKDERDSRLHQRVSGHFPSRCSRDDDGCNRNSGCGTEKDEMKHLTVISICFSAMAVLIAILALTETAFADDAWDAECAGTLNTYQQATSGADFKTQGVVDYNGQEWTWYSELILPGEGLTALNENGRTVNEAGFVVDGEGYISIATPNWEEPVGTIVDTPFGLGKVYDYCEGGSYDVYCSW